MTLDHLPPVVSDAASDPPERIPGAFDPRVVTVTPSGGFDWNSPPVAAVILVLGVVPLLSLRRRQRAREPQE